MDQIKQNVHSILWIFLWVCSSNTSTVKYTIISYVEDPSIYCMCTLDLCLYGNISVWLNFAWDNKQILLRCTNARTEYTQRFSKICDATIVEKPNLQLYTIKLAFSCPKQSFEASQKHIKFPRVDMLWLHHACDLRISLFLFLFCSEWSLKRKECSLSLYVLYGCLDTLYWSYIGMRSFRFSFR